MTDKDWAPKTRDEWVDLFADGIGKDRARKEEAEAKAAADKAKQTPDPEPDPEPSFAQRFLG